MKNRIAAVGAGSAFALMIVAFMCGIYYERLRLVDSGWVLVPLLLPFCAYFAFVAGLVLAGRQGDRRV